MEEGVKAAEGEANMKLLLINDTDTGGGAAQGAMRLLLALRAHGADAWMGVVKKKTTCPYVIQMRENRRGLFERCINRAFKMFAMPRFCTTNNVLHSFNLASLMDVKKINAFGADVVNLHWVGRDTLSVKDISRITSPIVWTMHDSWPVSGAEHYPNVLEGDRRYQVPYTKENKSVSTTGPDLCRWTWERKRKYLAGMDITFVAPSKWEGEVQKTSSLFADKRGYVIPNILDKDIFAPRNKTEIKKALSIPLDKKVLGFGAAYDINDPKSVKGGKYLVEALAQLKNAEEYFVVVFGPANKKFISLLEDSGKKMKCYCTGFIADEALLSCVYNALDVFICPSLIENLPFTCLEAQSCGVPVAAFRVGGIPDIVESGITGYLAEPYSAADLAHGVEEILQDKAKYDAMCAAAREKVLRDFDNETIVKKYMDVYATAMAADRQTTPRLL